jgi:hypothetical protein
MPVHHVCIHSKKEIPLKLKFRSAGRVYYSVYGLIAIEKMVVRRFEKIIRKSLFLRLNWRRGPAPPTDCGFSLKIAFAEPVNGLFYASAMAPTSAWGFLQVLIEKWRNAVTDGM